MPLQSQAIIFIRLVELEWQLKSQFLERKTSCIAVSQLAGPGIDHSLFGPFKK